MRSYRILSVAIGMVVGLTLLSGCETKPWVGSADQYLDALRDKDFAKAYGMLDEDSQNAISQAKYEEWVKEQLLEKLEYVRIRKYIKEGNHATIETEFFGEMKSHNSNVSARVVVELNFERSQWRVNLPEAIAAHAEEMAKKAEEEEKRRLVAEWKGLLDYENLVIERYTPTPEEIEMLKAKSPRMKVRDKKDEAYETVGEEEEKEIEWLKIPWWAVKGEVTNRGRKVVDQAGIYIKFYWKDDPRKKMLYDSTVYTTYFQYDEDPKYNKEVLLPLHGQNFQEVVDLHLLPEDWTTEKGVFEWELIDIRVSEPNAEQQEKIDKEKKKQAKKKKRKRRR